MEDLFGSVQDAKKSDAFERFKKAYPKRAGANPWKPAATKFAALVKSGVDPEKIISAAAAMAIEEKRKVGTEFIPMAVTWLNQQRYGDVSAAEATPRIEDHWVTVLESYRRFKIWSRYAGPDPDSPACRCPLPLLQQYGLRP